MAKDDVGDDLRFGRILFDLAAWTEPVVRAHPCEQLVKACRPKTCPLAAAKEGVPRDNQDILTRAHGLSLAMRLVGRATLMVAMIAVIGWRRPRRRLRRHPGSRVRRRLLADHEPRRCR